MYIRLFSILLATVGGSLWEAAGVAETIGTTNELSGPVRSVTIKRLGYSTTETYDRAGHLIEAAVDIAHANTSTYSLFRYDREGHLQEELALDPSGRLLFRKQVVYARDSRGRETASVTTSDDGGFQHAEFLQYDQRGHLWEQLWVNHSIAYKSLFDIFGRRIYSARYSKGELFSELTHRYDAQGRLRELVMYDAQGVVSGRVASDYDDLGRRVRATTETFGDNQPRKWITTYEYDAMGNWTKELTTEQSSWSQSATASVPLVQERFIQYYSPAEHKTP
ncbi:MAG: hypothetical protein A4E19_12890 [Nitrospira sp. SG-bin1]|nr:MAG: hypothetical protein A4E19_12890 [Nitrospira sp. SG-bin1]